MNPADIKKILIKSGLKKGDNQVIFYSDRQVMPFDKIWLSPPINILNHFRGLNIVQILSWIGWGILFISLNIKIKTKYLLQWIPIISGSAIFTKGRILLEKSIPVVQHNDVLLEVGELFTIIGISLIIGGVIVRYLMNLFPANLSN